MEGIFRTGIVDIPALSQKRFDVFAIGKDQAVIEVDQSNTGRIVTSCRRIDYRCVGGRDADHACTRVGGSRRIISGSAIGLRIAAAGQQSHRY
ncbi:hypothetical protein SDC9_99860 [bioreactor metagenome]|uniref:Uncharacterized protein n=1 Tax=bioreactor metagenome TaxID=1076179 RepID=A0A645AJI2_9ZZZZ